MSSNGNDVQPSMVSAKLHSKAIYIREVLLNHYSIQHCTVADSSLLMQMCGICNISLR